MSKKITFGRGEGFIDYRGRHSYVAIRLGGHEIGHLRGYRMQGYTGPMGWTPEMREPYEIDRREFFSLDEAKAFVRQELGALIAGGA